MIWSLVLTFSREIFLARKHTFLDTSTLCSEMNKGECEILELYKRWKENPHKDPFEGHVDQTWRSLSLWYKQIESNKASKEQCP